MQLAKFVGGIDMKPFTIIVRYPAMKWIGTLLLAALPSVLAQAPAITTKSYDNARSSANTAETMLTPSTVRARGLVKLTSIPVIGDARGMEAQPLISADGVMFLPSMANVVRAVRASDGAGIWQTPQLCTPVGWDPPSAVGASRNDMWHINDHMGMMSTGWLDTDTGKLYQVATCSADGSGSFDSTTQRMFKLDTRTGAVLASVLAAGSDGGMNYADAPRKQRAALLGWKLNGVKYAVMIAGSYSENGLQATGWVCAFDTFDNTFKLCRSTKAGGWESGQGPTEDPATGLMYYGFGNGPFDGVTKFGEAMVQMSLTPASATAPAKLQFLHAWAPFSDDQRTCQQVYPASKVAGDSAPSTDAVSKVPGASMPMNEDCSAVWGDQDAHLTGLLLPDKHLYVSAGKDGITYVADTRQFPDTKPADFRNEKANCAKVKQFAAGWDLQMDLCPTDAPALNRMPGGKTRHQHAPIVRYDAPSGKTYLGFCAENSPLQFSLLNADGSLTYIARGAEMASAGAQSGMPGCFTSVSSNAGANGIAWSSFPIGDANRTVTQGFLAAYDLTHLEDAQPSLPTLWKSDIYVFNKFMQPVVWNAQVYLPDYAGSVMVFGLPK
ncbi:MAG: hypothetical protein ACRYGF_02905 [Janthinobacterium lividum]